MRYHFVFILLILASPLSAQSTLESIPNQRLINGSYVSNPDKILDQSTITQIDTLLRSLENKTSVQVAVVVVESIGNEDIFEFAQKVFDAWGIGSKGNDNGLLLLLVKDKHTVRFHTGLGVEGTMPDVIAKRIQRDYMVPEFKNGNYNAGILAGLQQVSKLFTDPASAEELKQPEVAPVSDWIGFVIFFAVVFGSALLITFIIKARRGTFADSREPKDTPYPEMRLKHWLWLLEFAILPILVVALFGLSSEENPSGLVVISLYFYFMATLFHRLWRMKKVIGKFLATQDYYEIVEFIRKEQWYWLLMAILFPLPFFFYFFYHLARKSLYRNHPRNCKECQGAMRKVTEAAEDEYLSKEQQAEENLKSVDYDIWKCEACGSIEASFYLNRHSKYQPCPKCKTIAYGFVSSRTVKSATYSASGSGEEIHTCKFCGYSKKSTYTISQLTRSTTSSSSGSSSFGSSSSSSGGSWGGGSSGGGGASSSW